MLQAFEPPFDMGQDLCYEDDNSGQCAGDCQHFESAKFDEKKLHSGQISLHSEDESLFEVQISTSSSFISEVQKTLRSNDTSNTQENVGKLQQLTEDDNQIPGTRCHEARNVASDGAEETCNGTVGCHPCDWWDPSLQLNVPLVDVDKVRCIIRNIVRDWAPEGQKERDQCYKPILEELVRLFPDRCKERIPSCLVPGAGLGRLALEISCLGFISQGNEFSYYMMICSSFILNQTRAVEEWTIYPWIHSNCNSFSDCDQFRPVSFPDILPGSAGITDGFSMCGGDFVEVYGNQKEKASWDAVVTCFFLDTAHNIVEYIEVISNVLKDGGVWINVGPLLYHFADTYNPEDEMSIELSLEDVKKVVLHYGFQIEVEKIIETTYTTNPLSMMQNHYLAAFWTMKKTVQN